MYISKYYIICNMLLHIILYIYYVSISALLYSTHGCTGSKMVAWTLLRPMMFTAVCLFDLPISFSWIWKFKKSYQRGNFDVCMWEAGFFSLRKVIAPPGPRGYLGAQFSNFRPKCRPPPGWMGGSGGRRPPWKKFKTYWVKIPARGRGVG